MVAMRMGERAEIRRSRELCLHPVDMSSLVQGFPSQVKANEWLAIFHYVWILPPRLHEYGRLRPVTPIFDTVVPLPPLSGYCYGGIRTPACVSPVAALAVSRGNGRGGLRGGAHLIVLQVCQI
jgi:hypothetical protein